MASALAVPGNVVSYLTSDRSHSDRSSAQSPKLLERY